MTDEKKLIFVTGGVLSSLGKGLLASSICHILRNSGLNAYCMKIDPYLNVDAGTLNPHEHGEVFVTLDGHEGDLDLGNYERFSETNSVREQNLMMGEVYFSVLSKERKGVFLGKTVQLIPHVTNEIKERIETALEKTKAEILVLELGGTVGDIESELVLDAARQMKYEGIHSCIFIHLALVPVIITGEEKTKPMQHSVKTLLSKGIVPDFIIARSSKPLGIKSKEKIGLMCSVPKDFIFSSYDLPNVYLLPSVLKEQGFNDKLFKKLGYSNLEFNDSWADLLSQKLGKKVKIAVVGKYSASGKDAYMSVFEALKHSGYNLNVDVSADLLDSETLDINSLKDYDGILVPGGFGSRGVEGMIKAINYARINNKPFLGICYGMQLAVIEAARSLGLKNANSTEIDESTPYPVIDLLPEQKDVTQKGGSMRLGGKKILLKDNTVFMDLYDSKEITKRFRHRFEINPDFTNQLSKLLVFSSTDETGKINKSIELQDKSHPFFIGVQFHPEFDSRLTNPEPLFFNFIKAASK
ncbi:CTP synthase [uncultured archaeon]|nr:CTP synthase [uncultured archaeon]